jgi:hypothetical protein
LCHINNTNTVTTLDIKRANVLVPVLFQRFIGLADIFSFLYLNKRGILLWYAL